MIWAKNVLEVMFFAGLAGCAITVVISWISVGKDALSPDFPEERGPAGERAARR